MKFFFGLLLFFSLFSGFVLAVPRPVSDLVERTEPAKHIQFGSLEELTKRFSITSGLDPRDIPESSPNNRHLFKRVGWTYTCAKKPSGSPGLHWAGAYAYAADELYKSPGNCKVSPDEKCATCYCISGAAIKLCRGHGTRTIHVTKKQVGWRSYEVLRLMLGDLLGKEVCMNAGCDGANCEYSGWAANPGLEAEWHVSLEKC
ncbi:hypothetical protein ABW19_dt0201362 [Dactylella cylindrospora]|nr:hypothetical protein ABW19_dt0201362 [Dactylella cylindrospora]